jgi:hypothetical protein
MLPLALFKIDKVEMEWCVALRTLDHRIKKQCEITNGRGLWWSSCEFKENLLGD